ERNPSCLAEIGKLVGAGVVIDGEVGGLGESKVVYLGATDVATARELRSTTLSVGTGSNGGAPAAAVRLLEPDRYRGTLRFAVDVTGATVYVNGTKTKLTPAHEVSLPVGTHAVRVTHPEYHDFVRFIDVPYGKISEVAVTMKQYPIIEHDLQGRPLRGDRDGGADPPLWRRWYVIVPSAVALAVISGVIVGALVHDFPDGECRKIGGERC
ncbi:MAG: PEGA domain-containing protein, partial [Kofleriaceae bacterium]